MMKEMIEFMTEDMNSKALEGLKTEERKQMCKDTFLHIKT